MVFVMAVAYFLIFSTMIFQMTYSDPCSIATKPWTPELGIACEDSSIDNGKLIVAEVDITKITFVKFSPGNIPSVPAEIFSRFNKVKEIELGHCHVKEINSQSFINLKKLKYLNLVENELRVIPSLAFESLEALNKLDLGHNNISGFSNDSFKGLTGLTVMYLRNNQIKEIPFGSFQDLGILDGFYIDYNELEELGPDFLAQSSKVREIDLSHNKLRKLDQNAFRGLVSLKHLYLNHNNLSTLPPNLFSELTSLERLRLWHNSLTAFEIGTFDGLHNLQILELEHNKLQVIHENTFCGLVHLKKLEVQDNQISSFDVASILRQFQSLTLIKINNNRWKCFDLKNFTETLEDRSIEFDGGSSYKTANVDGIRCTNDNAFHITPDSSDPGLNDDDLKNSSLYIFFNGGFAKTNLSDYLESGFRNSNLYKFLNENFVNSSFYKFFTNEHMESFKEPKTEAFRSNQENTKSDSLYLAVASVGIVMFFVGLIFLVVVVRLVRKRRADDVQILVPHGIDNHELSSIQIP